MCVPVLRGSRSISPFPGGGMTLVCHTCVCTWHRSSCVSMLTTAAACLKYCGAKVIAQVLSKQAFSTVLRSNHELVFQRICFCFGKLVEKGSNGTRVSILRAKKCLRKTWKVPILSLENRSLLELPIGIYIPSLTQSSPTDHPSCLCCE